MFSRIVSDEAVLRGKPRIRGTRITVEFILELVASGAGREDIVSVLSSSDCRRYRRSDPILCPPLKQ